MSQETPHLSFNRRQFLRGLGASIALPFFYSMPGRLLANPGPGISSLASTADGNPLRMAFVYHPNGVIPGNWFPSKTGRLDSLPPTLEPLAEVVDSVRVLSGLNHQKAYGNGDGAGDHARANATFLTGAQAKKTGGEDIFLGQSIDQVIAERLEGLTPLPSLELSCSGRRRTGTCDSGYSCAYQYNLSWRSPDQPNVPEVNPRAVFERLYGSKDPLEQRHTAERWARRQSVLDGVRDDARRLYKTVSVDERDKLSAYLESVRAVEQRIESKKMAPQPPPGYEMPAGVPKAFSEYLDVMYELMALAFQTDMTRVATFLPAHDGSNKKFPEIDVRSGHHHMSHHKGEETLIEQIKKVDRFYVEAYARFLERLANTPDGTNGTLLDNSMIVYGGGIRDGNRHDHSNLPVLLAGKGGGALRGGDHLDLDDRPMCNLYVELANRMGVEINSFGDSTGRLGRLG